MSLHFPPVSVGQPLRYNALAVFPLFGDGGSAVDYLLADEAIGSGAVVVEETSEGGSVPELLVENRGDVRLLLLEGEELIGAKQNRVLNTSVLIAARSKVKIPVSCVEQGRWRYRSRHFVPSGSHSSSKLRMYLKGSVSRAVREDREHRSDQGAVWREVARQQAAHGASSPSGAMADTYLAREKQIDEFRENLVCPEGAVGMAVALAGKLVAIDVFDKPATCRKVWNRLLSGYVIDALETPPEARLIDVEEVTAMLQAADALQWAAAPAVGEGEEQRASHGDALHASSLSLAGTPIHASVIAAA